MYQLRLTVIHVVILVATTIGYLEMSSASEQCKTTVMDILMKNCRFRSRIKRGVEKFDLEKLDYKLAKLGKIDEPQLSERESGRLRHKRDHSETSAELIPPEQLMAKKKHDEHSNSDTLRTIVKVDDFAILSRGNFGNDQQSGLIKEYLERFGQHSPTPNRAPSLFSTFRTSGPEDVLGFDLSTEEFEELYNEISERIPRNSKDDAWKMFMQAAAKCCKNTKICREKASEFPCFEY